MRIIAGEFRGRRLVAPRGSSTRPTADRVKEAVFNILGPPRRRPFRALDLYAGSGALGLEVLSRGGDEAVLVDADRDAAAAVERNVGALGVGARARLLRREAGAAIAALEASGARFDWIFADPPYEGGALDRALRLLGRSTLLHEDGVVVAEHEARNPPAERYGRLALSDRRQWGNTAVSFYRLTSGSVPDCAGPLAEGQGGPGPSDGAQSE
jgi:16S rRNA (guanine(966)-N(2))-methyltransferase RsmD